MMEAEQARLITDLETLNEITAILNRTADVRQDLGRILARLIELIDVETGWMFYRDKDDAGRWWGKGFSLIAHHNLPPALSLDNADAWKKGCDCQSLCLKGKLDKAYNEVTCSRLASVAGDRGGLTVHASVPLRSGGNILGILNIAAPDWESFSPQALSLLTNVGGQIGVALERARLFELLQEQRIHEQAALLDFSNRLLGQLDLDELMDFLVEEARRLLDVDACALLLPDEEDPQYLRFRAASGWLTDPVAANRRVPADMRTGSGRAMESQQHLVVEWIDQNETPTWMDEWLPAEKFEAAAIVPLVADGHSIGTLVVDTRRPRRLEDNEIRFLQLMANQAAIALEKARLHREEIQRQRLEEELSVARQIQRSMLPPSCPQEAGWEVAAHYEAARQVGGDFYDFFILPASGQTGRRLAIVIADVADKGVPAALFMALSRTTIRNVAMSDRDPAAALVHANRLILDDSQTDLFLTAFYAALEPATGRLSYCNAGHNPPLRYRPTTGEFHSLQSDGIALGVLRDISLENVTIDVDRGDLLIFFTDGVTEAMNSQMEEFGLSRLKTAIRTADPTVDAVRDAILAALDKFTGEMSRWDDLTMVIARREP